MQKHRYAFGILTIVVLMGSLGYRDWASTSSTPPAHADPVVGPAIILFRGDDSPGCRAIQRLVDGAVQRYQGRIQVLQTNWSTDNPLIARYQIRFLPTVIFIDRHGNEDGRIVGESPAIQARLVQALDQAERLAQ